jgi:hypothetical protein
MVVLLQEVNARELLCTNSSANFLMLIEAPAKRSRPSRWRLVSAVFSFLRHAVLASMGVRAYTTVMPTFTPPTSGSTDVQVLIDWSSMLPVLPGSDNQEVENMLEWVRSHPQRGQLHVYLHRTLPHASARRLQNMLQALGCKVTTRYVLMQGAI